MPSKDRWAAMTDEQKDVYKNQHKLWVEKNRKHNREYQRQKYLESVGNLSRQSPLNSDPNVTKEKKRIATLIWQQNNPDKVVQIRLKQKLNGNDAAKAAKRRASKKNATPSWANLDDIKNVYQEAKYFGYHVDHIVPLQNDLVCGLHVWDNLQLLDATTNIKKSNKFNLECV